MAYGNRHSAGTPWLPTGNPDTTNISPTDFNSMGGQPGSLGLTFEAGNPARTYQRVVLDSGATSATPSGAVAANDLLYWKDKSNYIVTNDSRFAMGGASGTTVYRSYSAGVLRLAATPGYIVDLCQRGLSIPGADGGNTFAAGEQVFAEATATDNAFDRIGIGTACPGQCLGVARGVAAGGFVNIDLDIPNAQ